MQRFFTIVELLAVILVIFILITLTFSAIKGLRQKANEVLCARRMQKLGHGFSLYAIDNENFLPHEDNGSTKPPHGSVWYNSLLPYLGENEKVKRYRQDEGYEYLSNEMVATVFSYKMNSRLEDYKGTKAFTSAPFRDLSTVPSPGQTVLLFDGRTDRRPYMYQSFGTFTSIDDRHDGKTMILFLDWSVKYHKNEMNEKKGGWINPGYLIWDPDVSIEANNTHKKPKIKK
ncbi:MAG: hypothetical protein COA79_10230 [Planctomycetota bacterium]|nr:MAG: hypothetical protein COA79_10230 [Planctomycetota bacterium]